MLLLQLTNFDHLYFHFLFNSRYFLNFSMTFSLIHVLFRVFCFISKYSLCRSDYLTYPPSVYWWAHSSFLLQCFFFISSIAFRVFLRVSTFLLTLPIPNLGAAVCPITSVLGWIKEGLLISHFLSFSLVMGKVSCFHYMLEWKPSLYLLFHFILFIIFFPFSFLRSYSIFLFQFFKLNHYFFNFQDLCLPNKNILGCQFLSKYHFGASYKFWLISF